MGVHLSMKLVVEMKRSLRTTVCLHHSAKACANAVIYLGKLDTLRSGGAADITDSYKIYGSKALSAQGVVRRVKHG